MSSVVIAFDGRRLQQRPWQNHELAELYRAVDMLGRAGLAVVTDMGMSDEGDPWFAFCRADTGDVLVHCARIGGLFVASSVAIAQTFRGANFRDVIDSIVRYQPLSIPTAESGTRVLLHPAAVLTAFIATALLFTHRADAAELHHAVSLTLPGDHAMPSDFGGSLKGLAAIKAAVVNLLHILVGDDKNDTAPQFETEVPIPLAALMSAALTIVTPSIKTVVAEIPAVDPSLAAAAAWQADNGVHFSPFSALVTNQDSLPVQPDVATTDSSGGHPAWAVPQMTVSATNGGMTVFQVLADAHISGGGGMPPSGPSLQPVPTNAVADPQHVIVHPVHDQIVGIGDVVAPAVNQSADSGNHVDVADLGVIQPDAVTIFLGLSPSAVQSDILVSLLHNKTLSGAPDADTHVAVVAVNGQIGSDTETSPDISQPPPATTQAPPVVNDATPPADPVAPTVTPTAPIILGADPTYGLARLANYALDEADHPLTAAMTPVPELAVGLINYVTQNGGPLNIVVFDSTDITSPYFLFVKGVMFVSDHELGISPSQAMLDSSTTLDLVTGGTAKLLGVTDLAHLGLTVA